MIQDNDYYKPMERVRIYKPQHMAQRVERGIRFYSSDPGIYALQIRGPLALANGYTDSKSDVIAGARLTYVEAAELRDAIDEILAEKGNKAA